MSKLIKSAVLGAGLAMLQAPFGWPPYLVFILFIPFIELNFSQNSRSRFLNGFLFGFGYFAIHLKWLSIVGTDAWLGLSAICAAWWAVASLLSSLHYNSRYWPFWFASIWTMIEILRDHLPWGGFGWGQLGLIWIDSPFSGLYATLGQVGVTWLTFFVVALFYVRIYRSSKGKPSHKLLRVALVGTAVFCLSWISINFQPVNYSSSEYVTVAGIQGGVEHYGVGIGNDPYAVINRHINETILNKEEINKADLVIWPESSVDKDPYSDSLTMQKLLEMDSEIIPPVLVGTTIYDEDSLKSNSAQILNDGSLFTVYEKRHLVPFGEFMPLRNIIEQYTDRANLLSHDFKPGTFQSKLGIAGIQLKVLICFEVADESLSFEDIESHSAILIPTNNATYQNLGQTEQQAVYTRIRAIETGRSVFSIATSGQSVIVNPSGDVISSLNQDEVGLLTAKISKTTGFTLASKLFWPINLMFFMSCLYGLLAALRNSRITQ
ncbi:MAG: apolipoprotein N-acyltransferase [Actinomycetota bacterium]|jgi:apolipoprotein N-acyltransferase